MSDTLRLTFLGHSCVLVESADGRILLDPGNLTEPLEPIARLDAILVTHAHPDHLDPAQIRRVSGDRPVSVYGDEASSGILREAGLPAALPVPEEGTEIAGISVVPIQLQHETIVEGVALPPNTGFVIAGRVFAPGDSFAPVDGADIEVLLLPTGAPWMKVSETIRYMQEIAPRLVIPVHDAGLAKAHRDLHRGLMKKFAPDRTTVITPAVGEIVDVSLTLHR